MGLRSMEERRQAGSIETRQQAVDDDDDIELVFPDLIDFLLAGQPVVNIAVIGSELFHRVLRAEHGIIILHGFIHLVLIERVLILVFTNGIGNGDFGEISQLALDVIMDGDGRFLAFLDPFEELVIALGLFDGTRRQDSRVGIPFAPVQAELATGLVPSRGGRR